jgi:hypothetical protein
MATFKTFAFAPVPAIALDTAELQKRRQVTPNGGEDTVAALETPHGAAGASPSYEAASGGATWVFLALVVGGAIAGAVLDGIFHAGGTPLKLAEGVSVFGLVVLAAQLVERLIEPFSGLPVGGDKKAKVKEAETRAAAAHSDPTDPGKAGDAALAQADVDKVTQRRRMIFWGVATALGSIISGAFGVHFLSLLLHSSNPPDRWVDIAVTGLLIGGGSQPLHDLIEKVKESKEGGAAAPGAKPGAS